MNFFDFDHLVVYTFLLLTLVVGLWVGRKTNDLQDYAVANREYGLGVLTLTILATFVGANTILGHSAGIFKDGIIVAVVFIVGGIFSWLFMAFFVAPKMVGFRKCLTLGDLMNTLYGNQVGIIATIIGTLLTICGMGIQVLAFGIIGQELLNIQSNLCMVFCGVIFVLYASIGGMRAVAITDVIQFLVLALFTPLVAGFSIERAGGIVNLLEQIPSNKWIVFSHPKNHYYLAMFFVWSLFPVVHLAPPSIQRILMAPDKRKARAAFISGAIIQPLFMIIVAFIGFSALVAYPDIHPNSVFPFLVKEAVPKGMQGFAIIAVLSIVMSTADSLLHSAGLIVTHNLIRPICERKNLPLNELAWVRIVTCVSGFAAILLALKVNSIYHLSMLGGSLFSTTIVIPLVAGVMGLKVDQTTFFVSFGTTIITLLLVRLLLSGQVQYLGIPICIFANTISFFTTNFIRNKGFVKMPPKNSAPSLKPFEDKT